MKKKAASIQYLKSDLETPLITAIGEDQFARKIIETAIQNGIEIVENHDFFQYESLLAAGSEIPPEVYDIVAKILAYVIQKAEDQ